MGKRFNKMADIIYEWMTGGYTKSKQEMQLYILGNAAYIPLIVYLMIASFHSVFTINYPFGIKLFWFSFPIMLFIMTSNLIVTIRRYRRKYAKN